jgi:hypothetical protein
MDLAMDSIMNAVGYHLVLMFRIIILTAAVALLMLLDILIRVIAIASTRGCGWWLMRAFWGTLFQMAVAPMQWAMAKGQNPWQDSHISGGGQG